MGSSKLQRTPGAKLLACLLAVALLAAFIPLAPAQAAASDVTVTPGSAVAGAVSDYTIEFSVDRAVYAGDEMKIIFPSAFDLSNVGDAEVTVSETVYDFAGTWTGTILTLAYTGAAEIPAGRTYSVSVPEVGNPTTVGDYTISVRALAAEAPVSDTVSIVAAAPAQLTFVGPPNQLTAGEAGDFTLRLQDQYGNVATAPDDGIEVTLEAAGVEADTVAWGGEATQDADDPLLATGSISGGNSELTFTFESTQAAAGVTITASAADLDSATATFDVVAAGPEELTLSGPANLEVDERGTYTVGLLDEFGNPAVTEVALAVTLASDPAGEFYSPPDAAEPLAAPAEVTIAADEGSATFAFAGGEAALTNITATADGLEGATWQVAVGVAVLNELAVTVPETAEVGIAVPVEISLRDQNGAAFAAPEDGVEIGLATDAAGVFYDRASNGSEVTAITVPAGSSSVTVYYVPDTGALGEHNLTFTTDKILSDGSDLGEEVTAQATVTVGPASALWTLAITPEDQIVAGERAEVEISIRDSYGNPVPAPEGGRVIELETTSPEGAFYADATSASPVTEVTMRAGESAVSVYYEDTLSWTRNAAAEGYLATGELDPEEFSSTWAFRSVGVIGFAAPVVVAPADARDIVLDLAAQEVGAVPDELLVLIGSRLGETDLVGVAEMRVGVVDAYGNPVPQEPLLRIAVNVDSETAFMRWDNAGLADGEWAEEWDAWLVVTGPGTYTVTASAGGFADTSQEVVFEEPSLVIATPEVASPDAREPVTVRLTNLWAAASDLEVALSATSGAFYADPQAGEEISSATIPAYENEVTVYFETDDPAGTDITLTASIASLELTAEQQVSVAEANPAAVRPYWRGWNIISTPWALQDGRDTIDQILAHPEYIEAAYGYRDGAWYQVTTADPASLELRPLEAMYVKLKGATQASFWAQTGIGLLPPSRELAAGWNLVGNPADDDVGVRDALASVTGRWDIAVSPGGLNQEGWTHTSQSSPEEPPSISFGNGIWVYMNQAGTLTGLAFPPLQ